MPRKVAGFPLLLSGDLLPGRLEKRRIQNRPKVNYPPQKNDPQDGCETEVDDCHEQSALNELSQPGNEKAAERSDHVAC
jgi:hypothetical protein